MICALPICANPIVNYDNGVYHVVLDGKKAAKKMDFVSVEGLETNAEVHKRYNSLLTVNAGFFDPKNKKTISYISSRDDGFEDPMLNEALIANPILNKNLVKILDRTEFRLLECADRKYDYEIVSHSSPVPEGCFIVASAQGGPEIYPRLRLEEEFFVQKDVAGNIVRESCSVLHKTARTIISLKNKNVHLFIITNKNPMTLQEAAEYVKSFNVEVAMAFDGGSSTSLDSKGVHVVSTQSEGQDTGRKLKSFLIYLK